MHLFGIPCSSFYTFAQSSSPGRVALQVIVRQLLENLVAIHRTGIVHRDVKPQNVLISDGRVKFIDLGAGADLRVGINYVPNEYLLDPRYAPPQQYVMSPLTPKCAPAYTPSSCVTSKEPSGEPHCVCLAAAAAAAACNLQCRALPCSCQ